MKALATIVAWLCLAAPAWGAGSPADKNVLVYMTVFAHLERDSPLAAYADTSQDSYRQVEANIIAFAKGCVGQGVTFDLGVDANWVLDENKWGDRSTTGGTNLFVYLDNLPGVCVEPHAHETRPANDGKYYNTADVESLLIRDGVRDYGVVGGVGADGGSYTEYLNGQRGNVYAWYTWHPTAVHGPETNYDHQGDPRDSGLWQDGSLALIAGGRMQASDVTQLLDQDAYDRWQMNTAMISPNANDSAFYPGNTSLNDLKRDIANLQANYGSDIYWANLPDMVKIWQTYYNSQNSLTVFN